MKGYENCAIRTLERNQLMQLGPQPKEEDREGGDRQIPAVLVAGGEGEVAREVEWTEVNLLVGWKGWIVGQRVLVAGGQELTAEVDGVPVALG